MASRIEIITGGTPSAEQLAALGATITAVLQQDRGSEGDHRPSAYRSRWRRAAMLELSEVPMGIKDNGTPWGGTA